MGPRGPMITPCDEIVDKALDRERLTKREAKRLGREVQTMRWRMENLKRRCRVYRTAALKALSTEGR